MRLKNINIFKKLKCGHSCSFVCHSGKCSSENDCLEKVMIKCKCKTIKKNFVCNKIRHDPSLILNEKGFFVECSEKCKSKFVLKEESTETKTNEQKKTAHEKTYLKFVISFLILFVALILGYFLVSKS